MKLALPLSKTIRKLNQIRSLPKVKTNGINRNSEDNSINNDNSTTNASAINSILKNSINTSLVTNKKNRLLKKIKLNSKYNSQRSINRNQINSINKRTIEILENADQIMRERMKYAYRNQSIVRREAIDLSKEVNYNNQTIKILKQKRIDLTQKELFIQQSLINFENKRDKEHKRYAHLMEEMKIKQKREEEMLYEIKHKKEQTEELLEKETSLNKKLEDTLERRIKAFYDIKNIVSLLHKIIRKQFIYDEIPEISYREKNYEDLVKLIINLYEKENENEGNELPSEFNNIELFMNRFPILEEKLIERISNKESLDKENEIIQKNYENELKMLKLRIKVFQNDLNNLNEDKKNIILEMNNYKVHDIDNNYLYYINELGNQFGINIEIKNKDNQKDLSNFVSYTRKILDIIGNKEILINDKILEIVYLINNGSPEDKQLIQKIIENVKNKNKREKQLQLLELQDKIKQEERLKIAERGRKKIVTGRKFDYYYLINKDKNKEKDKYKKIIKKDDNINIFDCQYFDTDIDEQDNY